MRLDCPPRGIQTWGEISPLLRNVFWGDAQYQCFFPLFGVEGLPTLFSDLVSKFSYSCVGVGSRPNRFLATHIVLGFGFDVTYASCLKTVTPSFLFCGGGLIQFGICVAYDTRRNDEVRQSEVVQEP